CSRLFFCRLPVLQVAARLPRAGVEATLDRLLDGPHAVVLDEAARGGGVGQSIFSLAARQPAARDHGAEPERRVVERVVASAGCARGKIDGDTVERRAGVGTLALAGFI